MDMAAVECLSHSQLIRLIEHDVRTADNNEDENQQQKTLNNTSNEDEEEDSAMSSTSSESSLKVRNKLKLMNSVDDSLPMSSSASSTNSILLNQNLSGFYDEKQNGYLAGRRFESNNLYSYYKQIAENKSNIKCLKNEKDFEEADIQITAL